MGVACIYTNNIYERKTNRTQSLTLFPRRGAKVLQNVARGLVDGSELGEVARVRPRGPVHEVDLLAQRAGPEQEHHDQRVREPHLGPVHGPVARPLRDRQHVMVRRVEDHALERGLRVWAIWALAKFAILEY